MFINQSVFSMSSQSAASSNIATVATITKMNYKLLIICVIFIVGVLVSAASGDSGGIIDGDSEDIDIGLGSIDHQRWQRIEEDKNGEIQLRHQRHYYNRHHIDNNNNNNNNNPIIEDDDELLLNHKNHEEEEDVTQGYRWSNSPPTSSSSSPPTAQPPPPKQSSHHIAIRHHNHHHQYHHRRYQTTTTMSPIINPDITTTIQTTTTTPKTTTTPATIAPIFPTEEHRLRHSNKLYQPYALAESTYYSRSRRQHSTVSPLHLSHHHQSHQISTKSPQLSSQPPPHLPWYEPIKRPPQQHHIPSSSSTASVERTFYNVSNVMRNHYFDGSSSAELTGHRLSDLITPTKTKTKTTSKSLSSHLKKRKYRHPYDVLQIPYKDRLPRIKIHSFKWDDEFNDDDYNNDNDDSNDNDDDDDDDNNDDEDIDNKKNNWKMTNIVDKNGYDSDNSNDGNDDDDDNNDSDGDDGDDEDDDNFNIDNRKWNKVNDRNVGHNRKRKASLLLKSSERFGGAGGGGGGGVSGNSRSGRSRNIFENSGVNNKNNDNNNKNNEDNDDGYVGDEENINKRKFSNLGHINRNKYLSKNIDNPHDDNQDEAINDEYSPNDDIGSFTNHKFQMLGNAKAVKDSMTAYRNTQKSKKQEKEFAGQHANRVYMEASCKLPRPRIVPVQSGAAKTYVPHCTILYRCGDDTGCCNTDANTCVARRTEAVDLYFYVTTLNSKSTTIEKQTFVNHTECHCVSKRSRPLHPPPEPLRRATILSCTCPEQFEKILQEDGTCRCDCSTGKYGCEYQKLGKEHFSISDRKCILDGRCKPPTCEYGSYIKRSGKCPMKSDKLMRSFSRRAK